MPTVDNRSYGVRTSISPGNPPVTSRVLALQEFSSWVVTKNPNWRRLKPISAYFRSGSVQGPAFYLESSKPSPGGLSSVVTDVANNVLGTHDTVPSVSLRPMMNQAINDLASKMQGDFVATTSGAEFPKALSLIAATAQRLSSFVTRLKKFDIDGAASALGLSLSRRKRKRLDLRRRRYQRQGESGDRFAASSYLEYRYGWVTLMMDLEASMKALAEINTGAPSFRCSCSGKATGGGNSFSAIGSYTESATTEVSIRYKVYYTMDSGSVNFMRNLGIQQSLATPWEVVPFSFVVDWFLPIGTYLQNKFYSAGLTFHSGYKNVKKTTHYVKTISRNNSTQSITGYQLRKEWSFERTPLTSFPEVKFPSFRSPFNGKITRVLDAVALLRAVT